MAENPIMIVNLSISPEEEAAFNEFYHHKFLPEMLKAVPQILSIRRYEELGIGGTLRWYDKQFLTLYELAPDTNLEKVDGFFALPVLHKVMEEFSAWKTKSLRNFSRITFRPRWTHERKAADGQFGSRPFFLWAHEMKPDLDRGFQSWYENEYLPLQIADIPSWSMVHRYTSVNREPVRHLTFMEAATEEVLIRCLTDLRAGVRISENYEWKKRVDAAVNWHDATSFRPIYRRPG